jgi:hypothetical protein
MVALALSTMQPLSEITGIADPWDDRTIDTAWDLLRQSERKAGRNPGAGGPQYSG